MGKKRKKAAKKALDEFLDSKFILGKIRTILMMEDYDDKAVKYEFRSLMKDYIDGKPFNRGGKNKRYRDDDEEYEYGDNKHRSAYIDEKDPTKVRKPGKYEKAAMELESIFGGGK